MECTLILPDSGPIHLQGALEMIPEDNPVPLPAKWMPQCPTVPLAPYIQSAPNSPGSIYPMQDSRVLQHTLIPSDTPTQTSLPLQ